MANGVVWSVWSESALFAQTCLSQNLGPLLYRRFTTYLPTYLLSDRCIYKGVGYTQGQRWDDGCDLECVCENAIYGFYRCNKK